MLRDTVVFGVEYLPIIRITERGQKRKPTVEVGFEFLAHKILYIFEEQVFGKCSFFSSDFQQPLDFKQQPAPRPLLDARTMPRHRDVLAWERICPKVCLGEFPDFSDIAQVGRLAVQSRITFDGILVYFRDRHYRMRHSHIFKCLCL